MQESIVFLLRVQCRRKESSRSLSHLLMSFLLFFQKCFDTVVWEPKSNTISKRLLATLGGYQPDNPNKIAYYFLCLFGLFLK